MLVEVKMPYGVSYLPPRCRTPRQGLVWKQVHLSIDAPDASEAPVAFRIATRGGQETPRSYEIRSFRGRTWWPVLDRTDIPMSVTAFIDGLSVGRNESLNVLNPKWVYFGGHQHTYDELFGGHHDYRIVNDRSEELFAEAQRGAAQIIVCGDVLYVLGGPPVFFGCRAQGPAVGPMSLRIGCLPPVPRLRIAGPTRGERNQARDDGLLFDPVLLHRDLALLKSCGYPIDLVDGIDILIDASPISDEVVRVSADAVVRRLFNESTDILSSYRDLVPTGSLYNRAELLPIETCREIVIGVVNRTWPGDGEDELAAALSCAAMVEQRLQLVTRPSLAAEDDDALGSLGSQDMGHKRRSRKHP